MVYQKGKIDIFLSWSYCRCWLHLSRPVGVRWAAEAPWGRPTLFRGTRVVRFGPFSFDY